MFPVFKVLKITMISKSSSLYKSWKHKSVFWLFHTPFPSSFYPFNILRTSLIYFFIFWLHVRNGLQRDDTNRSWKAYDNVNWLVCEWLCDSFEFCEVDAMYFRGGISLTYAQLRCYKTHLKCKSIRQGCLVSS